MKIICSLDLNYTNHLDHFVPFCDLFGARLIIYSQEDEEILHAYYPKVNYLRIEQDSHMFTKLARETDILVTSTAETGEFLSEQIEKQSGKKVPYIFLPHGQSDKAYAVSQMVTKARHRFVYGAYMKEQIRDQNIDVTTMFTLGNFRRAYYTKYKAFFDQFIPKSRFNKEKTLLYAPTWNDHENSSSIREGYHLVDELAKEYNLIVKLHPLTLRSDPGYYYALESKVEQYPHAIFASTIPCVYPFLAAADIYLGDYSSIGYDFLSFDRPLFFLSPSKAIKCSKGNKLLECGHLFTSVEEIAQSTDIHHDMRKKHYEHAFSTADSELMPQIAKLLKDAQ